MLRFLKSHKWKSAFVLSLITLLIAFPYLAKHIAKQAIYDYTHPFGIQQVTLENLRLNLFKGTIDVQNLNLYQNTQSTNKRTDNGTVHIGELRADIAWLDLLQKRIRIQSLHFANTQLPFALSDDNQLFLAGIPLTAKQTQNTVKEQPTVLLPGLDNIQFNNIQLSLAHKNTTTTFSVNELTLKHLYAWSNNYGRLQFKAHLNQSLIQANLQLHLFATQPKIIGTLKTEQLNTSKFKAFLPKLDMAINGFLDTNITFTMAQTDQGPSLFQQGTIKLSQAKLSQQQSQATLKVLNWQGDLYYQQSAFKKIDLDGKLTLKQLTAQKNQQTIAIAEAVITGKSQLSLAEEIKINARQNMSISGLQLNDEGSKQTISTDIVSKINAQLSIHNNKINLQQAGQLTLQNLAFAEPEFMAQLNKFHWAGDLTFALDNTATLQSTGEVALNQFDLKNRQQTTLIQTETATIEQIAIANLDAIRLKNITFNQLTLAKNNKLPGLVTLQNLSLNQADYLKKDNKFTIKLGNVNLQDSQTHLTVNQQGQISEVQRLINALPAQNATPTQKNSSQSTNKPQKEPLDFQIDSINISGKNPIYIVHQQVKPALRKTLQLKQLSLEKIATQQPETPTTFNLKLGLDEFSNLTSRGTLTPLNPSKVVHAKTSLDSLSLVDLSPLVEAKLGYHIASGQLSAELETDITNNQINAKNQLHLHKFELKSIHTDKTNQFEKGFPVPLQTGLAMLQDKNDNIDLSLPIKGDLTNPDFNINDIIATALGGAIAGASRTYLLLALQPFGAIALAGEYALDKASAIRLQAVDFGAGSDELTPAMQSYLKKIAKLLQERKAIQIKVCGGVTEADRTALKQAAIQTAIASQTNNEQNSSSTNPPKITVPDITINQTQMLALATKRQKAIKRYLMQQGAASKQVVICKPEIVKGAAKAQVKLTI